MRLEQPELSWEATWASTSVAGEMRDRKIRGNRWATSGEWDEVIQAEGLPGSSFAAEMAAARISLIKIGPVNPLMGGIRPARPFGVVPAPGGQSELVRVLTTPFRDVVDNSLRVSPVTVHGVATHPLPLAIDAPSEPPIPVSTRRVEAISREELGAHRAGLREQVPSHESS